MKFDFTDADATDLDIAYDLFLDPLFPESGMQICVAASGDKVVAVKRVRPSDLPRHWTFSPAKVSGLVSMLKDFLTGENVHWDELSVLVSGTEMQRAVWQELTKIPYGKTISYAEMAKRAGHPAAVRAIGSACGANPIPLILPCHRVIASDGTLGGFAWGLPYKEKLLATEQRRQALAA